MPRRAWKLYTASLPAPPSDRAISTTYGKFDRRIAILKKELHRGTASTAQHGTVPVVPTLLARKGRNVSVGSHARCRCGIDQFSRTGANKGSMRYCGKCLGTRDFLHCAAGGGSNFNKLGLGYSQFVRAIQELGRGG